MVPVFVGLFLLCSDDANSSQLSRSYSLASTKTSLELVVSDLLMTGMLFFKSLWKSMSGPSVALPVDFSKPEISPVLSISGAAGLGGSEGASFWPKSMRSFCSDSSGAGATPPALSLCLGGIEFALIAFCPLTIGYIARICSVCFLASYGSLDDNVNRGTFLKVSI